jgi:hypothetical protein
MLIVTVFGLSQAYDRIQGREIEETTFNSESNPVVLM